MTKLDCTTPDRTTLLDAYKDLKGLAKALNIQARDLHASMAEVRGLMHEVARLLRKASKQAPRRKAKTIAPVTIFHDKGGPTSVKGHECTEPPPVNAIPCAGARE